MAHDARNLDTIESLILGKAASVHMAKAFKNFIGGEWVESRTGQTYENLNPADTRDVVGVFQKSDKRDVDDAVSAARQAFERWRLVPAPKRAEIIYRAGEIGKRRVGKECRSRWSP